MTFNSLVFVYFFAVVYGVYLVLARGAQNRLLLVASYFFYGYWDYRFAALLAWTLDTLEACDAVDTVVVAVHRQKLMDAREFVRQGGWAKVAQVCRGGMTRQDSVREALWRIGACEWVAVHDGARPCADARLLTEGIEAARATGAAIPALAVSDTVKRAGDDGRIIATVERTGLYLAQTPQVFRRDLLWKAYEGAADPATDDAGLLEQIGRAHV